MLANKKWIKAEMDPKVCVAAVSQQAGGEGHPALMHERKKRKTHMHVQPQICVSTDIYIYSCCLYILYCMMLVSCIYCIITQYVFPSVKAGCSDLGLTATDVPS